MVGQTIVEVVREKRGMTLIEMIGVLGVIAVLAGLLIPRVFEVISDSKIHDLTVAVKTYETSITKYYHDVGTILPLNVNGTPQIENSGNSANTRSLPARLTLTSSDPLVVSTNLWPKFHGPYLEKFDSSQPPSIGTRMFIPVQPAVAHGTPVTGSNTGWDLKGNDGNSDIATGANVAYLRLTGLGESDFMKLDHIIDKGIGTANAEKMRRGRAKYDLGSSTLYLYLVSN